MLLELRLEPALSRVLLEGLRGRSEGPLNTKCQTTLRGIAAVRVSAPHIDIICIEGDDTRIEVIPKLDVDVADFVFRLLPGTP